MNKVTVTKKEMEAIERQKVMSDMKLKHALGHAREKNFCGASEAINLMSEEQIVLAWHGHAEVEPEYVGFEEAVKARREGKRVLLHAIDRKVLFRTSVRLDSGFIGTLTINELISSKYEIVKDDKDE